MKLKSLVPSICLVELRSARSSGVRGRQHGSFFRLAAAWVALVLAAGAEGASPEIRDSRSLDGISYWNERTPEVPWSVHIIKVDRSRKDLNFFSALARGKVVGVSLITEQARAVPKALGRAVAGINGDFYLRDNPTFAGDPRGLQITGGELVSGPSTVCVWFDTAGNPHLDDVKGNFQVTLPDGRKIPFALNEPRQRAGAVLYTPTYAATTRAVGGRELFLEKAGDGPWLPLKPNEVYRAQIRSVSTSGNSRFSPDGMVLSFPPRMADEISPLEAGAKLEIATALTPDLKGVKNAIAGGPALIQGGKAFTLKEPPSGASANYSERSKYERHPRSAVGWSPTHVYLISVDGRQPGLSVGMKLAELAEVFVRLGCTDAMNFDGGKSAQLWLDGGIVNSPSQGEDTVANSLLVLRKPGAE